MLSNNYFELFNIKPCVFVNHKELDLAFQKLQKLMHPDTQKNLLYNNASIVLSTKITTAYDTLKKPLSCVNHMLEIKNCNPLKNSSSTISDIDLLAEIMDLEEQLMNEDDITLLKQNVDQKISKLAQEINSAFLENNTEQLQKKALYFYYYFKLLQKLKN